MEPWGFEPQIQPCHGRVIPFHYGPDSLFFRVEAIGNNVRCRHAGCVKLFATFSKLEKCHRNVPNSTSCLSQAHFLP